MIIAELSQQSTMGNKVKQSTHPKPSEKIWQSSDRTPARPQDRPFAQQANQCKITQSAGMATQMQLEVILAGKLHSYRRLVKQGQLKSQ